MFDDEDLPTVKAGLQPRKLDGVSREELKDYLIWLENERSRTEEALASKGSMAAAAEALFRK